MSEELRDKLQATLGSDYVLERELGGGGMSRVFVAEDKTLGRRIVVKMLPSDTAAGVSVERFKREIQVVARLQHPHIVPVLSAGQVGSSASEAATPLPYYTMPFVKGESLRARLARGGEFSINETVHILRDVAAALAYAHGEGVVHRDIKPDNVIVSGGVAVVTDFGVAKAVDVAASSGDTPRRGLTSLGIALGTPAYMSPEQASADPQTDHRADIYSFGVLAYELLAGSAPFAGRPPHQILAAQVSEVPDPIQRRRPNVPPALATLVMRCLEKRAGDRPQSADELLTALDAIATTPSGGMQPTGERLRAVATPRRLVAGAAALIVIAAAGYFAMSGVTTSRPLSAGATTPIAVSRDIELGPAISPDGRTVAFSANGRIVTRQIEGGRASPLSPDVPRGQFAPQWSPDGSRISFATNGAVYVVPERGGAARRLTEGGSHSWSPDGRQLAVSRGNAIWLVSVDGGTDRQVAAGAGGPLHSPTWTADGRLVTYVEGNTPSLQNLSASSVWAVSAAGGRPVRISDSTHVNLSPQWMPDGRSVLYISNREGTRDVYQQRVRSDGSPAGAPSRVTTALASYSISLSRDGTRIAYDVVRNYSNIWVVGIPAAGSASMASARQVTRENQHIESLSLSHDGQWLAYDSDRDGNANIYKVRVDGGEPIQVTSQPANEFDPGWSPDDREIAFHSMRTSVRDIFIVNAEGGSERQVTRGPGQKYSPKWSPDGRHIAFLSDAGPSVISRGAGGEWSSPKPITGREARGWPHWSPDGTTIAFPCAGRACVVAASGGATRSVSDTTAIGFVQYVAWARDPSVLYAWAANGDGPAIWSIPLRGGAPRRLLAQDATHVFGRWDFTTDGKRLFFTLGQWEADVFVMDLRR